MVQTFSFEVEAKIKRQLYSPSTKNMASRSGVIPTGSTSHLTWRGKGLLLRAWGAPEEESSNFCTARVTSNIKPTIVLHFGLLESASFF